MNSEREREMNMSLKALAEQILSREHVREQAVNMEVKIGQNPVHEAVNRPISVPPVETPTQEVFSPAAQWLQPQLATGPKLVAFLVRKWTEGTPEKELGARINELNAAREELGLVAYFGQDFRWWWQQGHI